MIDWDFEAENCVEDATQHCSVVDFMERISWSLKVDRHVERCRTGHFFM